MTFRDGCATQLLLAADKLIKDNSDLSLAAETVAAVALEVASGDEVRAEYLLSSLEKLLTAAIVELQKNPLALPILDTLGPRFYCSTGQFGS